MNIAAPSVETPAGTSLESAAELVSEREIAGFVYDPAAPERRFVVELWLDGWSARIARADLHDHALAAQGLGDGGYGFVFALDAETVEGVRLAEVRIANSDTPVGLPVPLSEASIAPERRAGEARWVGGLRISGWLAWDPRSEGRVRAFVDGDLVAETRAQYFSHVGEAATGAVARGFELTLPFDFADGRLRRARILDDDDRELPGSPCPFVAFPRGLEHFLEERADLGAERLRAAVFDRLLPQSLPFTEYASWSRVFPPAPPFSETSLRLAVALIGEEGLDETLESLEEQSCPPAAVGAIRAGAEPMSFQATDLLAFLASEAESADVVVFAPAGARLHPLALGRLAEALALFPEAPHAYCDIVVADGAGREWPLAFPAFDYERSLEQGYAAFFFASRVGAVRAALERGAADLFRLFNAAYDAGGPNVAPAVHAPGFLARLPAADRTRGSATLARATREHLEARRLNFVVEPRASELLPAAKAYRVPSVGKVSVIVPTRNRVDLLRPCLESLKRTLGKVAHEILVVDNASADPETLAYLDEIADEGVRVAKVGGPFNFARLVNAGASVAGGETLLLLNNDVEAQRDGWLEEMLSRLAEADVGAVGAKLVFPSGGVQHGGVVLGPNVAASHAFDERQDGDPGYAELMRVAHETSAVTAACLLTPRRLFRSLGGFDAVRFPVLFNDVDYCLRLRAVGRRVVMTPHAKLIHKAGSSRGPERPFDGRHRHQRDLDNLRMSWAEVIAEDPFYSPMLALDAPYAGLAWPPRSQAPRGPRIEGPKVIPPGF